MYTATEYTKINFGRYKGMKVSEVIDDDHQYLLWAHDNMDWFQLAPEVYAQAVLRQEEMKGHARLSEKQDVVHFGQNGFEPLDYEETKEHFKTFNERLERRSKKTADGRSGKGKTKPTK